jgi:TRAP-type C4-dicarboxylate transport system substrate-binding protein
MDEQDLQVEGRLSVREEETAFLVVREEDPNDWLARFEKDGDFPAREWAENMANVYNRRPPAAPPDLRHLPVRVLPVTIPSRRARCDTLVARAYV